MYQKFQAWLQAHPKAAGALAAAEGAAAGAVIDVISNPFPMSKAGLKQTVATILGAVIIAVRNYLKNPVKKEQ